MTPQPCTVHRARVRGWRAGGWQGAARTESAKALVTAGSRLTAQTSHEESSAPRWSGLGLGLGLGLGVGVGFGLGLGLGLGL